MGMTLHQKLLEIRRAVPYLQKEKENQQQHYKYVSSSQTIASVRAKMDEMGVLLMPSVKEHNVEIIRVMKERGESVMYLTKVLLQYTWINVEDPKDILISEWASQGIDTSEKGIGKALTYGEKYFFLRFFQIATDKDDPDAFAAAAEELILASNEDISELKRTALSLELDETKLEAGAKYYFKKPLSRLTKKEVDTMKHKLRKES